MTVGESTTAFLGLRKKKPLTAREMIENVKQSPTPEQLRSGLVPKECRNGTGKEDSNASRRQNFKGPCDRTPGREVFPPIGTRERRIRHSRKKRKEIH